MKKPLDLKQKLALAVVDPLVSQTRAWQDTEEGIDSVNQNISESKNEIVESISTHVSELNETLKKKLDEELLYEVDEGKIVDSVLAKVKIPDPIPGTPGKDADQEAIIKEMVPLVLERIPAPEPVDIEGIAKKVATYIPKVKPQIVKQIDQDKVVAEVLQKLPKLEPFKFELTQQDLLTRINKYDHDIDWKVLKNIPYDVLHGGKSSGKIGRGGATLFTQLRDAPSSYTGQGGKIVAVKSDLSGLEFIDNPESSDVDSVTNSDGTLTISPTTGAVVASLNLGHANTWSVLQTFTAAVKTNAIYTNGGANPNVLAINVDDGTLWNTASGNVSVDFYTSKLLDDANGYPSVDWIVRQLNDSGNFASINYDSRILYNTGANPVVTWGGATYALDIVGDIKHSGTMYDAANVTSLQLSNRLLYDSAGTNNLNWYNASGVRIASALYIGSVSTAPTALLHLKAGTTAAGTAPLKFTTGTSMTAAEAGAMEYTTDDLFFTIATGAARKRILFADAVGGLTSGRVPYVTTNGRLLDTAGLTYNATLLTITSTTSEKFRIAYDGSSYTKFLQNSGGLLSLQPFSNNTATFQIVNTTSTAALSVDTTNLRVAVGHSSPSSALHVIKTTEQLRLGYDASNYLAITTSSGGAVTYDAIGSGTVYHTFLDKVGVGSGTPTAQLHVFSTTEQLRLQYDGSNYVGFTLSSSGQLTLDSIGSNPKFVIQDPTDINAVFNVNYNGAGSIAAARVLITADTANTSTAVALDTSSNGVVGRLSASSSIQKWQTSNIRVLQTSTAGYTVSDVDVTETSTGSGVKLFANWKIGGSSRFTVSTRGEVYAYYDASNYWSAIVSSAGAVTFDAVGASAGFTFSDPVNITSSLQCDSIVNDTGLASGTYTPTLTGVNNVSSSTARQATYMRVGNTVTVAGQIDITPTANNIQTTIGISLPIASAFTTAYQAGGSGHRIANTTAGHGASIQADATNDRAELDYYETHGATDTITYQFTYQVI